MAIYSLFSNISARSGLGTPFTTAWSKIDNISWGVNRQFSYKAGSTSTTSNTDFGNLQLSKPIDGASAQILKNGFIGTALPFVNIAITDATAKTIIALKLSYVMITSEQVAAADSANEVLSLAYKQIAIAVLTAGTIDTTSWDVAAATAWSFPSTTFTLDTTYGIKIG